MALTLTPRIRPQPPTVAEMMAANKVKISGTNPPEPVGDFSVFPGKLQTLLKSQGFTAPTPIQCTAWPVALAGENPTALLSSFVASNRGSPSLCGQAGMSLLWPRRAPARHLDLVSQR